MEGIDDSYANWPEWSGEELVRELLDDESPLFFSPEVPEPEQDHPHRESIINKLISKVYSGPTISDIESALSVGVHNSEYGRERCSAPMLSFPEKGMGRIENKYTLKVKVCGSGLTDDGYKWRKYGQKSIKNSPNPRSYYRCTNPRCNAKKQVEKSSEDPETLVVTYEGLHLHYTSHFFLSRPQDFSIANLHAPKKPKNQTSNPQANPPPDWHIESTASSQEIIEHHLAEETAQATDRVVSEKSEHWFHDEAERSPKGLLEDIVPLMVRKPCTPITSSDPYSSSQVSSPSTSSISWPFSGQYLDVGVLSSII